MTTSVLPTRAVQAAPERDAAITKVSIVVSHGSLEGIYPALILANGARMEGIEATLFFTFFGMDAITKKKQSKIHVATVGNPALGGATMLGALPGVSVLATRRGTKKMAALSIRERAEARSLIHEVEYVELSGRADFNDMFIDQLAFPG